ncbi:MAG: hypothetical protein Kow0032_11660 [Methyloligellaceae bacterium]
MAVEAHPAHQEESEFVPVVRTGIFIYLALLLSALAWVYYQFGDQLLEVIDDVWFLGGVGVFGAIIANSTGTGGGVVFIPAFIAIDGLARMGELSSSLQLVPKNAFAISFLIQCFGMSVGSLVWIRRFYGGGHVPPGDRIDGYSFIAIVFTVLVATLPALLVTQFAIVDSVDGALLLDAFKWGSVVLGIVLLIFTWSLKRVKPYRFSPEYSDIYWLFFLGLVGGVITAFFSVGVGELVAVYLILRKFPTVAAVALAVVISAVTVIAGVWIHIIENNIIWPIALMAVPGAMVGGFIARLFALALGPIWLKTFASVWITLSSLYLIFGPSLGVMPAN